MLQKYTLAKEHPRHAVAHRLGLFSTTGYNRTVVAAAETQTGSVGTRTAAEPKPQSQTALNLGNTAQNAATGRALGLPQLYRATCFRWRLSA